MSSFLTLPLIPSLWASGGDAQSPIPETQPSGANRASFQYGWPAITSMPVADGGIPPNRLDFNGIVQTLTAFAYAIQQGQYTTYNSTVANKIGGYPQGAILWYINNGQPQYLVQSIIANNTNSDLTDTSAWQPLTLNPYGAAMLGTLTDQMALQLRNIAIVDEEPTKGVDGAIYAIIESQE